MFKIIFIGSTLLLLQGFSGYGQSAIGQLENITGQKINRYNTSNSSNSDMNSMISGMFAQSLINSIFAPSRGNYIPVREAKVQPSYLTREIAGEKQRVEQTLKIEKYKRLMKSYKFLNDSSNLTYTNFTSKKKQQQRLDSAFLAWQKKLIQDRLKYENKLAKKYYDRLSSPVPLPNENKPNLSLKDLKPGDVLLFEPSYSSFKDAVQGIGVVAVDGVGELLAKGTLNESKISHTITFLKEENGKRLYLDNMPDEGPVIISEAEMQKRYVGRNASVAQIQNGYVAQPLNEEEAGKLLDKAQEMAKKNIDLRKEKGYDSDMLQWENTLYGAWGKDNVVCSEASWALLKATGRELPLSKSWVTQIAGVNFSPSDFYNYKQTFLINRINIGE